VQVLGSKGELTYTLLHTNINKVMLSAVDAFYFYNGAKLKKYFLKQEKRFYNQKL
jgi:hypothetical protein